RRHTRKCYRDLPCVAPRDKGGARKTSEKHRKIRARLPSYLYPRIVAHRDPPLNGAQLQPRRRGWRSRGAESNRTFLLTLRLCSTASLRTCSRAHLLPARCKLDVTGIILFQSKILSGPRAQDELLNLAACGQWELVDELNVSGNLKVRNTSLAELLELDRSDLRPRFELHGSGNFLPVLVARDSVHGHVAHRRMRSQVFLDLLRVDVLPSTDDHVLDSARDHTIAIRVHGAQIAGS